MDSQNVNPGIVDDVINNSESSHGKFPDFRMPEFRDNPPASWKSFNDVNFFKDTLELKPGAVF